MSCPPSQKSNGQVFKFHHEFVNGLLPMPQPPPKFFGLFGNLPDLDPSSPPDSFWRLSQIYGPILVLDIQTKLAIVSNQRFIDEICDQSRFEKQPNDVLQELRPLLGDGLFTAFPTEENWGKAHRLLVPAFGPIGIKNMFEDMLDISSQMILRWERFGPEHAIDCSDDLTRLAFDTIGLCTFGYRFNEFYSDNAHPFARQMAEVLLESGRRASRPRFLNGTWFRPDQRKREENVQKMHQVADSIVAERKRNPRPGSKDLLNTMLNSVDRETGERLSDENIRYNMCTFLVAGHETTSATLSFCYYNLLKNPEKLAKARRQVDEIVGSETLQHKHIAKLTYLDACVKETLRLNSPIPVFVVKPKKDETLGGKFIVPEETYLLANLRGLHHDPEVWGNDIDDFRPERMLDGSFQALPPNSWKPFGNGMRACIGKAFAEQEMILNIALVLQRFEIEFADPSYELKIKCNLTLKPEEFLMKVRRRERFLVDPFLNHAPQGPRSIPILPINGELPRRMDSKLSAFTILFGGNTGTCEGFAQDLETKALTYGLGATIADLDSATRNLPVHQPIVIITASYEGKPPDNSKRFVTWLEECSTIEELRGTKFTVFGVGNSDWTNTFHRVPKFLDDAMESKGGTRFHTAGYTDAKTDLIGSWEEWMEQMLQSLSTLCGTSRVAGTDSLSVSVQSNPLTQVLGGSNIDVGTVLSNFELTNKEIGPSKKHMEIRLPTHTSYSVGDYLVVLPRNPPRMVKRVLAHFRLVEHDVMTISGTKKKFLPIHPMSIGEFLSTVVELGTPITRHQFGTLVGYRQQAAQVQVATLNEDETYLAYRQKRYSIIDILEEHRLEVPFCVYVDMLQPLSPRQYSISSSPRYPSPEYQSQAHIASITYDVLENAAWSLGAFQGTASTFLASCQPGDHVACFIRPARSGFHLPDESSTPIIMIAAGTGIAPMRAFLQERVALKDIDTHILGPATLFFGCRHEDKDFLYKDELHKWEAKGVVQVKTAFSRMGCSNKYVQDIVWEHREQVLNAIKARGKIFVCGSAAKVGKSAADVCKRIYREDLGCSEQYADEWLEGIRDVQYVSDVFS